MAAGRKYRTASDHGSGREQPYPVFSTAGGVLKTMQQNLSGYTYLAMDGVDNCIPALKDIACGKIHHCFIEMSACTGSCIGGPVMEKYHHYSPVMDYAAVMNYAGTKDFVVSQPDVLEVRKAFDAVPQRAAMPTESEISAILRQMGKFHPSQEPNCGSCGYDTCREKAIAVAQGKAEVGMCLPYPKEKAESFSDAIVKNMPASVVVLNEQMEVQQINAAARQLMNIRYSTDVLGEHVGRILDPEIFTQVL